MKSKILFSYYISEYNIHSPTKFPGSEGLHHSYTVSRVDQPQSSSVSGPLARSSGRQLRNPFQSHNADSPGFERQASPILKGCMQDKSRGGSDSETPGKKKSVHFVKPFTKQNDLSGTTSPHKSRPLHIRPPAQVTYSNRQFGQQGDSAKLCDMSSGSEDYNHHSKQPKSCDNSGQINSLGYHSSPKNQSTTIGVHSSSSKTNSPYMDMRGIPPQREKYLIGQRRDSLSDCEGDSQGAYSDGDTTTSGSYCMDDEDMIGPDVYV